MQIKRIISTLMVVSLLIVLLAGCNDGDTPASEPALDPSEPIVTPISEPTEEPALEEPVEETDGQGVSLKIVCTIFPQYDWVRNVLGEHLDRMELVLLQDGLVDLHSYSPTFSDVTTIASSDLFIYIGGESDEWVHDVLEGEMNPDMVALNLMDALGNRLLEEVEIEGAEDHHHDHDHDDHDDHDDHEEHDDHDDHDDHDHDHEHFYDEHIWLSLENAQALVDALAIVIGQLDPANALDYVMNAAAYRLEFIALDSEYHDALDDLENRTLLFASRFPFLYMMEDYGLNYYAAFSGCSAETEASFETIAFLTERVNEHNLSHIMVTECADRSIADTIIDNSRDKNQQIVEINAIQSVSRADVDAGATYLQFMQDNLDALIEGLS